MDNKEISGPRMAAIGAFDGVHLGHRSLIAGLISRSLEAGYLPMIVTFDRHPLELIAPDRAPALLMTPADRRDALNECISHVEVIGFDERIRRMTAREFMAMLHDKYHVDAIYMGFNHHFGSDRLKNIEAYRAEAEKLGMKIFEGSEAEADGHKVSSSIIRRLLGEGDVVSAEKCLGHPYRLSGIVVKGQQLGRKLGFPTANLQPFDFRQLIPSAGVYACVATLSDGHSYKAMVNIGVRPTVDSSGQPTIEAHLLDFSGDLYGSPLTLDFIARIRSEQRFPSLEALAARLRLDAAKVRKMIPSGRVAANSANSMVLSFNCRSKL